MTEREIVIDMKALIDNVKEKINMGQSVILRGQGVSMLPFIDDKDSLTIEKLPEKIKVGEIYLFKRSDGSYAIHRVFSARKKRVLMLGDAQLFIEPIEKECLVARVSIVEKPDKTINCNSFSVRLGCVIRMKSRIFKVKCKSTVRQVYIKCLCFLSKIKKKIIKKEK